MGTATVHPDRMAHSPGPRPPGERRDRDLVGATSGGAAGCRGAARPVIAARARAWRGRPRPPTRVGPPAFRRQRGSQQQNKGRDHAARAAHSGKPAPVRFSPDIRGTRKRRLVTPTPGAGRFLHGVRSEPSCPGNSHQREQCSARGYDSLIRRNPRISSLKRIISRDRDPKSPALCRVDSTDLRGRIRPRRGGIAMKKF